MSRKVIFLFILVLLITGCSSTKTALSRDMRLMGPITEMKNSINFTVDPRIEIISIVQFLSKYPQLVPSEMTKLDFNYKKEVMDHFGIYYNHKAVRLFNKMMKKGFTYDAPPGLMLFMDDEFNLREDVELTDYIIKRASGEKNIYKLFNALKEFVIDTNFNEFYNKNRDYYQELIHGVHDLVPNDRNTIEELEEYYGVEQKSYNITLVSLYGFGAYGPRIDTKYDESEIYSIMGPSKVVAKFPRFYNEEILEYLTQHEFSHSFINPITSKNLDLAKNYELLYIPIREDMKKQAYANWEPSLNEHIIRALTARFAYHKDNSAGLDSVEKEKSRGFIYVEALFNKLEDFENNRDKYPTIEDFYPELLKSLEEFQ